ncbi:hypothetical protein D1AOALGA4SA_5045 [Olavius algarvensis Delta 1 endosymbiont]|nr:hypothetical protein D1AOALGA4SA_5045 [Olavius algarvensis Delta 1 endosymbiont]
MRNVECRIKEFSRFLVFLKLAERSDSIIIHYPFVILQN